MPTITYQNTAVNVDEPDSLLEALEEADFDIPYSCRAGICHSCMMQSESEIPVDAQQGLSENQKAQGFFLACCCFPKNDMDVSLIGDTDKIHGTVMAKAMLNESVLRLDIQVDCRWFPGQYLTVWHDDIQGRSYSIASRCDENKTIELHIKRHDQGLVSRWLHDDVSIGQELVLSKPMGNCFYSDAHHDKPILMVSTGTGLAPLYGILLEALAKKHSAPIYLYAAAGEPAGLYYLNELVELAKQNTHFHYIPTVRRDSNTDTIVQQDVVDLVKEQYNDLKGWKIFLCGSPDMIKQVQRHCFFQGAAVTDILVDAFVIDKPE